MRMIFEPVRVAEDIKNKNFLASIDQMIREARGKYN